MLQAGTDIDVDGPMSKYPADARDLFRGIAITRTDQVTADPFQVTVPPPESVHGAAIVE